ncbi:MAG: hypothetical protein PHY74_06880 [Candidatus Bathyarchaeota archaeon]|jgi:hypothetical protein|nr:hypothetical protein [Candidatus Bathyarchaeota archaeon]MDD4325856.1 hypothetical protein [Candidatus Bathyarchaeota archaeon]MDI9577168.1 hypothetical protein [Thermoproteota archaeon]NLD66638.1 hypothetical protein [Thermoproteota archaeon]
MFTLISLIPQMFIYINYLTWITGAAIAAGLIALWIFPSHNKKVALILGAIGIIQIISSGFAYYPHHIFVVFPLHSIAVGSVALISAAAIAMYGIIKKKNIELNSKIHI